MQVFYKCSKTCLAVASLELEIQRFFSKCRWLRGQETKAEKLNFTGSGRHSLGLSCHHSSWMSPGWNTEQHFPWHAYCPGTWCPGSTWTRDTRNLLAWAEVLPSSRHLKRASGSSQVCLTVLSQPQRQDAVFHRMHTTRWQDTQPNLYWGGEGEEENRVFYLFKKKNKQTTEYSVFKSQYPHPSWLARQVQCLKQSPSLPHTWSWGCRNGEAGWESEQSCPFPHPKTKRGGKKYQGKVQNSACPEALYNIPVVFNAQTN